MQGAQADVGGELNHFLARLYIVTADEHVAFHFLRQVLQKMRWDILKRRDHLHRIA